MVNTSASTKYLILAVGVVGAAAGLNLGVLGLAPSVETVELASGSVPQPPVESAEPQTLEVSVDVPVVVPDQPSASTLAAEPTALAATTEAGTRAPANAATPSTDAPTTGAPTTATPTTATPTTAASTTATPTTAASTTTTAAPTTTTATASTTEYLYFEFSSVASQIIIADHQGEGLEFWSVTPEEGWEYRVEEDSSDKVEIEFRREDDESEAKFVVSREDGELEVKKER